ncbi:MAG TPA: DUF4383 domain-containing protein [Pseudonocardiaceae bacterium]
MTGARDVHPSRFPWPQQAALVIGAVYLLIGLAGFVATRFDDFAEATGEHLLGFGVNPLHNVVHLLIGLAGMASSTRLRTSAVYGWALAVVYGLVFLFGLFAVGRPGINLLNLNWADNVLHLATAAIGVVVGLGAARLARAAGWTDPATPAG